jgi:hypothetical protein
MNLAGKSIIAVAGVAALWAGGWYAVKAFVVEPEADRVIEQLRSGDLFFAYDKRDISGFPFGYSVRYENIEISNESGAWRWSIDGLSADRGASSTHLVFDPESVLSIKAESFGAPAGSPPVIFEMASEAMNILALDDPESGRSAITADKFSITQKGAAAALSGLRMEMAGLDGEFTSEGLMKGAFDFAADSYTYKYRVAMPDGSEQWGNASSGTSVTEGNFDLGGFNPEDPMAFLQSGGALNLTMKSSDYSGETVIAGSPAMPPLTIKYQCEDTDLRIRMENGQVSYGGAIGPMSTTIVFDDPAPFPSGDIEVAGMSFDFQFPFNPSDEEQPYLMAFSIADLAVDEVFWSMGDPSGALKRTPVNFDIELGGDVLIHDYLNALKTIQPPADSPAEVRTVEIRKFDLSALGVAIGAKGDLTILNGAETPNGVIDLNISGISALLDQLVSAGLIPAPAADQYRLMWPAFMVSGAEPDSYTTKIEAQDGQISVNGQRVQ